MKMQFLDTKISMVNLRLNIARILLLPSMFLILYGLILTVANDVSNYEVIWDFSKDADFLTTFFERRLEIGSLFLLWAFAQFFSANTMIYLTGLIGLSIKYYLFNKYLHHALIAFGIYVLAFAHILDANQIRAALACCFIFYAIFAPPKSKYTYLFLASFALLFHYSGVIILSLYFINIPALALVGIIFLGFAFDAIVSSSELLSFAMIWLSDGRGSVSLINSFFIMQILISIICTVFWGTLSEGQKRGAFLNMVGVAIYIAFLDNPIVAHRMRELSQLGIFAILFLGSRRLSAVKFGTAICFSYIVIYNLFLILSELILIFDI